MASETPLVTSVPQTRADPGQLAGQIATLVVEKLRNSASPDSPNFPRDEQPGDSRSEDPVLHARIDVFRDMFSKENELLIAERGLRALLGEIDLGAKPWAKFRILTNLGSIALMRGRETETVGRYVEAYALRPDDPNAKANLSLVRSFEGKYDEAMEIARDALSGTPRPDMAVSVLLQAAARSGWRGEPESLVPADLVGSVHADLGIAEFLRRRDVPGWAERSIVLADRHPDVQEFRAIFAVAVLSAALESEGTVPGGLGAVSAAQVSKAADIMLELANRMLDVGFADDHDRTAHLNNAAVLLRLCNRHGDVEALLRRAGPTVGTDVHLRRLMALALAANSKRGDAIASLEGDVDAQNRILRAELLSMDDPAAGLAVACSVALDALKPEEAFIAWQAVAGMALMAGDVDHLKSAVASLRRVAPDQVTSDLFALRGAQLEGMGDEDFAEGLRTLAARGDADITMASRYFLATELLQEGCAEEACVVLQDHVDVGRVTGASVLYLQSLAASRRDKEFLATLEGAIPELRDNPSVLYAAAARAWNAGDLERALPIVLRLLQTAPDVPKVRLFKIELLIRLGRSDDVLEELGSPLERLDWREARDRRRLAAILAHFGYRERAVAIAYRFFLENQDAPQAWMTFASLMLGARTPSGEAFVWPMPKVGPDAAVDLLFDDGDGSSFIVEGDRTLRQFDGGAWEPGHVQAQAVMGLGKGDRFEVAGRGGVVRDLKHKFVERLHRILRDYERRFPELSGLRSISVAPGEPGGLDEMKDQLRQRHDWINDEQEQFFKSPQPLGYLAARLHLDPISVAEGLAAQKLKLRVAAGDDAEKRRAMTAIRENRAGGCVMDLHSFWTAWRLGSLDVVTSVGGPVHVCRSVLDGLLAMKERLEPFRLDGLRQSHYEHGQMFLSETPAEVVQARIADIEDAVAWLLSHAMIEAVEAYEDAPAQLRESLRLSDIYDALLVAIGKNLLLVVDDAPTRLVGQALGFDRSCWTHVLLFHAKERGRLDPDMYVRWIANLIAAGHAYVGVGADDLVRALQMDMADLDGRDPLFRVISESIGGRIAEQRSHLTITWLFLERVWNDPTMRPIRRSATSHLLERLVSERHDDYGFMLAKILQASTPGSELREFVIYWLKGHFVPFEALRDAWMAAHPPEIRARASPTRRKRS